MAEKQGKLNPADLKKIAAQLEKGRQKWKPVFDELRQWFMPYSVDTEGGGGEVSANKKLLNPTPAQAASYFASGFTEGVVSRTREWFKLGVPGFELDADVEVGRWLAEVERRMRLVLSSSNFYQAFGQMFLSMGVFGNGAVYIEEDEKSVIRCHSVPIEELAYGTGPTGRVVDVLRTFTMTRRDLVVRFGNNVPDDIREMANDPSASLEREKVFHLTSGGQQVYWLESQQEDEVLEVSPVREWPWAVARWEVVQTEPYALGLGLAGVGAARMLQHAELRRMKGLDKMEDPPVLADQLLASNVEGIASGGITFVPGLMNAASAPVQPIYSVTPPLQEFQLDIARLESQLKSLFYNDLFLMISQLDTVRTATEIIERRNEKITMLGPVLQRIETEVLSPALDRVFAIMWRRNLIPEPPRAVAQLGGEIQVQYISMLHQAQQATETISLERLLATFGNAVAVWPEARDKINVDEVVAQYADKLGVNPAVIRSEKEVEQLRRAQAEQAQAQQAIEQAQQIASSAKVLSETDVGGGANALQMLLGS